MKRSIALLVVVFILALAACQTAVTPPATEAPPPTQSVATDEPAPATAESAPATSVPPTVAPPTQTGSPLFGTAWDDRSLYAAGLLPDQQALLDQLPDAPITHMQITLDDRMQTVTGRQAIRYTNAEDVALTEIYFHLFPNLLDGAITVGDVTVNGQSVSPVVEGPKDERLRVPLPAPLAPGESAVIEMEFITDVPTDIGRNYGILATYDDVLALAHFYPMPAVYDDEGWNIETPDVQGDVTYSDTGYYLVEVTAPAQQQLVAGGVIVDEQADGATQTVTYAAGPMRDFYLAASDRYTVLSDTVNGVRVNSYGPRQHPEGVQMALDVAMATLAGHSDWLAPYPFAELDIVATPTSALGVEYPGIIANTARMYDIDSQTAAGVPWGVILESTTAHEVGHQWFYSLVGNDQLDEPWLDEALTQYATYHYYLDRYGEAGGEGYFNSLLGRWERVDSEAIPIGLPVADYEGAEYGAIVYGRGPVFVRALADEMGLETFDAFLRDYVTSNWLGIGTADSFRALAESHCDCDLGPLFEEWVTN